jgi:TolB protein
MPGKVGSVAFAMALLFVLRGAGITQADSEKIVFTFYENNEGRIFLMEGEGSVPVQLSDGVNSYHPALSPDGKRVAFVAEGDVFVLDIESGDMKQLTERKIGTSFYHPDWSPDGKRIVCIHKNNIYIMDSNGENLTQLAGRGGPYGPYWPPSWSPDGKSVLFTYWAMTGWEVMAVDVKSGQTMVLAGFDSDLHVYAYLPCPSPDGRQIAFVGSPMMIPNHLYVMDADGGNVKRLTHSLVMDFEPVWSPDGTEIAFRRSFPDEESGIYVMNADGSGMRNIGGGTRVDWSPDSRKLVFVSYVNRISTLFVVDSDGRNRRELIREFGAYSSPDWLSDGRIAFTSHEDGGIYTVDANGDNRELLIEGELNIDDNGELRMSNPVWSPDIKKVVYQARDTDTGIRRLYISDFDGRNERFIMDVKSYVYRPSWSPDGKRIVIGHQSEQGGKLVHIVDAESGDAVCLGDAGAFLEQDSPCFSPDGRRIVFSGRKDKTDWIYVMNADGSDQRPIGPTKLTQKVTDMTWSPDGSQILFSECDDFFGGEIRSVIYRMDTQTGRVEVWLESAQYPDWIGPSRPDFSVTPRSKLLTTWGKIKQSSDR